MLTLSLPFSHVLVLSWILDLCTEAPWQTNTAAISFRLEVAGRSEKGQLNFRHALTWCTPGSHWFAKFAQQLLLLSWVNIHPSIHSNCHFSTQGHGAAAAYSIYIRVNSGPEGMDRETKRCGLLRICSPPFTTKTSHLRINLHPQRCSASKSYAALCLAVNQRICVLLDGWRTGIISLYNSLANCLITVKWKIKEESNCGNVWAHEISNAVCSHVVLSRSHWLSLSRSHCPESQCQGVTPCECVCLAGEEEHDRLEWKWDRQPGAPRMINGTAADGCIQEWLQRVRAQTAESNHFWWSDVESANSVYVYVNQSKTMQLCVYFFWHQGKKNKQPRQTNNVWSLTTQ